MKKNNKKGFTLVELVIVVAVMAVLVAVAIPTVGSIVNSAEESTNKSNARTIESMIKLAEAENDGTAPGATEIEAALVEAKLGIDEGTYVYDPALGTVTVGSTATSAQFLITFAAPTSANADGITVAAGTANNG